MNLRQSYIYHLLFPLFFIFTVPGKIVAVAPPDYPDTIYIPVTFYDFHSDSSNPEFEITPNPAGRKLNMVAAILDNESKPVVGSSPYFNRRIDRWFRKWVPGDDSIYNYGDEYPARYRRYSAYPEGMIHLPYDTSFKNIVIYDTLPFLLTNSITGTYQFVDDEFFPLDGRGFGNEGRSHNYSFAMELHWQFTKIPGLSFSFTGDDDVWAFVDGSLRMDIGGIHSPVSDQFNLDRIPELIDDQKYNLDFFYVERHVTGSSIRITTNILSPTFTFNLDIYPNDTICPFTEVVLSSSVTDDISGTRPDLAQNTQWRVLDLNGQSPTVLQQTTGQSVSFIPNVAYSKVILEGAVFDGKDTLKDTVFLYVEPCKASKIYIEANPVDTTDTNSLRYPQELQQISILENMTNGEGYAIARDTSGAYVRLADPVSTEWSITPDGASLAQATGEPGKKYRGIITRIGVEGNTYAVAEEPGLRPDSVLVIIARYYIVKLQLRDSLGNIVDTISMSTDDYQKYSVWGLKSTDVADPLNPDSWVQTNVKWTVSDAIQVKNVPPERGHTWLFDPTAPGTGILSLVNPDDARTDTLRVPVIISRAPADSVSISLITPQPRHAGDTLLLEVKIFNSDGLVPGTYCFKPGGDDPNKATYRDTLGIGGGRHPWPALNVDGVDTFLNILGLSTYSVNQCFEGGIDTVKVVLFYAPFTSDSMHQISVSLGPDLNARTERFILQPSILDSIGIEDANYNPIPPQTLTGIQSVTPYSDGYDQYGNRIGFTPTTWNSTGTLDPIDDFNTQTYITAEGVTTDQNGTVCSSTRHAVDSSLIQACLPVTILGPRKNVTSAITRDLNGDGFLDGIEIHFDRVVDPSEISVNNFVEVCYSTTCYDNQLTGLDRIDSVTYLLSFNEDSTPYVSQTYWQPSFKIMGTSTIAENERIVTTDGAGPVIWTITKDVSNDVVTVTLSEQIKNINGSKLEVNVPPSTVFNVYLKNSNNSFSLIPTMLDSISVFDRILYDSVLVFRMSNGEDLSQVHWMNLKTDPQVVRDNPSAANPNTPHPDNVKRKVTLIKQKDDLKVAPNPTRADFTHTGPGTLTLTSSEDHVTWARRMQGVLIQVVFTPPADSSPVGITMKFYDMVGNLVNWVHTDDIMMYLKNHCGYSAFQNPNSSACSNNLNNASVLVLKHYWNGSNREGMKVAPGIYRVVYYIDYQSPGYNDIKHVKLVGFRK